MALIKCPDCGKEVSDTAKNCPQCGYNIARQRFKKNMGMPMWIFLPLLTIGISVVFLLSINIYDYYINTKWEELQIDKKTFGKDYKKFEDDKNVLDAKKPWYEIFTFDGDDEVYDY